MFLNVFICKNKLYQNIFKSLYNRYLYLFEYICKIEDGEDMLLYQGVLAFELFTGVKADKRLVETMRNGLKQV